MRSVFSQHGSGRASPAEHSGRAGRRPPRTPGSGAGHAVRSRQGRRGFTLVEMIAVITVIAILAAAVAGGVVYASRKAAIAATTGLLGKLSLAINGYKADYGAYPPESGFNGYTQPGASLNMPAESLWYYLAGIYEEPAWSGTSLSASDREKMARPSPYLSFREKELKRTGIDFFMNGLQNKPDSNGPDDPYPEIVDAWGVPILYKAKGNPPPEPRANKYTFDLVSRGPDRRTGDHYEDRDQKVSQKYVNRDNIIQ